MIASLPIAIRGVLRGKLSPKTALLGDSLPRPALQRVRAIYAKVDPKRRKGKPPPERNEKQPMRDPGVPDHASALDRGLGI